MVATMMIEKDTPVPEIIVRVLEEAGIDMVFGMPGGNMLQMFDALYDHQSKIRTILVRHESLAGIMAEVYGRLTGKPGVVMGQGAFVFTNAMLGVMEGHLGCSPMLIMADLTDNSPYSHHAPYQAGTGEYGTWDAKQSFAGVTKMTMVLHEAVQAVQATQMGIRYSMTGECGPVALLYHSSVLRGRLNSENKPRLYSTEVYLPSKSGSTNLTSIQMAAKILSRSVRPIIVAGNGVRVGQAYSELQNLAESIGAPVVTTASGKGVFPETHDLALGVFGNYGLPGANAAVGNADVVVVVGSKLSPTDTAMENPKLLDPQRQILIQIDVEPNNAGWTFPCEHSIICDASVALSQLVEAVRENGVPSPDTLNLRKKTVAENRRVYGFYNDLGFSSNEIPIIPQRIISEINQAIPDDGIITCDAGENRLFMTHYYQTKRAGTFIQPAASGAMGYAIPAALAAKLIYPNRKVVAVCGDGGFAMAMNGLITAYEEGIIFVTVVLNNRALGWIKHSQGDRIIAAELGDTDCAGIARAMGWRGVRIEEPRQLRGALLEALSSDRPTVLDVITGTRISFRDVSSPLINV